MDVRICFASFMVMVFPCLRWTSTILISCLQMAALSSSHSVGTLSMELIPPGFSVTNHGSVFPISCLCGEAGLAFDVSSEVVDGRVRVHGANWAALVAAEKIIRGDVGARPLMELAVAWGCTMSVCAAVFLS